MALSREARIMIGILMLAAAVFVWSNFFLRPPAIGTGGADSGQLATPSQAVPADGIAVSPELSPAEGTPVIARDIEIAELPFLVTAPPEIELAPQADEQLSPDDINRPQSEQRASVNPFSPIIVQEAAATSTVSAPPPTTEPIDLVEVPIQGPPGVEIVNTPPEPIVAPTPRALTPPAPPARNLPRTLPNGVLSVTPDILRTTRAVDNQPQPVNLAEVAAIRVPGEATPDFNGPLVNGNPVPLSAPEALPEPLAMSPAELLDTPANSAEPLAVATNSLSRYLRDNNVIFTGSVLGPVGVAVFRSSLSQSPLVVTLGQTLPETDIVLTDLKGQQAEFTQDNDKQTLILDLRR